MGHHRDGCRSTVEVNAGKATTGAPVMLSFCQYLSVDMLSCDAGPARSSPAQPAIRSAPDTSNSVPQPNPLLCRLRLRPEPICLTSRSFRRPGRRCERPPPDRQEAHQKACGKDSSIPWTQLSQMGGSGTHVSSPRQMVGDVGQDDTIFKKKGALQHEGALIVEDVLPPTRGKNFGDDDGNPAALILLQHLLDIFQQRPQYRAIGRRQYRERHATAPLGPLNFHPGGFLRIHIHENRANVPRRLRA